MFTKWCIEYAQIVTNMQQLLHLCIRDANARACLVTPCPRLLQITHGTFAFLSAQQLLLHVLHIQSYGIYPAMNVQCEKALMRRGEGSLEVQPKLCLTRLHWPHRNLMQMERYVVVLVDNMAALNMLHSPQPSRQTLPLPPPHRLPSFLMLTPTIPLSVSTLTIILAVPVKVHRWMMRLLQQTGVQLLQRTWTSITPQRENVRKTWARLLCDSKSFHAKSTFKLIKHIYLWLENPKRKLTQFWRGVQHEQKFI